VRQIRFEQSAQQATLIDYLHEVDHMAERVKRLEQAIGEAIKLASPEVREVVNGLRALRGIAEISAVTIVAELGCMTRFAGARQLMAYCGTVPSENSSGQRTRRGGITKTGNAHLRRIIVEAAWSYRHRPAIGHRLRMKLAAAGKDPCKIVTAVARELLGFVWAIGVKTERSVAEQIAA
jgi:transposase